MNTTVQYAEQLCKRRGLRWTALRQRVFEILVQATAPMSAYDILAQLDDDPNSRRKPSAPPTVYRALDFLMSQGLVHRLAQLNAYVPCDSPDCHHNGYFLICKQCGEVTEIVDDRIDSAVKLALAERDFIGSDHNIEITGRCLKCQAKGAPTYRNDSHLR